MATFIKSDDQTYIDKYRVASNITVFHKYCLNINLSKNPKIHVDKAIFHVKIYVKF